MTVKLIVPKPNYLDQFLILNFIDHLIAALYFHIIFSFKNIFLGIQKGKIKFCFSFSYLRAAEL